jgi:hypothetical protein
LGTIKKTLLYAAPIKNEMFMPVKTFESAPRDLKKFDSP